MKIKKTFAILFFGMAICLNATERVTSYIPLAQYEHFHTSEQSIKSKSIGLVIERKNFFFVGITTFHKFHDTLLFDFPRSYQTIDILSELQRDNSQILLILKSSTDCPESLELQTFQSAIVYGYKFLDEKQFSLIFGGGIAVSDFGIEYSNGKTWPIIPVPLLKIKTHNQYLKTKFEFISSPNLDITLFPTNHIRATFEGRFDKLRDERDLLFESKLHYRFFSASDKLGDIAGVAIGFKNSNYGAFNLAEREDENCQENETLEIQYHSVFAELDLSLLKVSAGYNFDSRELYETEKLTSKNLDDGWFLSVQGAWKF